MTGHLVPGVVLAVLLVLVSSLVFSQPGRVRQRLLRLGVRSGNKPGTRSARDASRQGEGQGSPDGLRDTAMMLELVAAMLDAGSGIGRSLELIAASASKDYRQALRPVVSALAIG
ncbi:MAG: type II secretion system F family protein, partial [Cellulosimicrobium cellulans]